MKQVKRREDMSPIGCLHLLQQDDGDIVVNVMPANRAGDGYAICADIEFCTYTGGGKSPHTLKALSALMNAMELDNLNDLKNSR